LIEQHGGSLTLTSVPARGTLVRLHFPIERLMPPPGRGLAAG